MSAKEPPLPPLSPDVKSVIDTVRAGAPVGPAPAARERTRARLMASLGHAVPSPGEGGPGQAGPGATPGPPASSAAAGSGAASAGGGLGGGVGSSLATKPVLWTLAAIGSAGLVGGTWMALDRPPRPAPDGAHVAPATATTPTAPPSGGSAGEPAPAPRATRSATQSLDGAPEQRAARRQRARDGVRRRARGGTPRRKRARGAGDVALNPAPTPFGSAAATSAPLAIFDAPSDKSSALDDESKILARARRALAARQLDEVERAIDAHRSRFVRGQLAEERDAIAIRLLLARQQHQAARAAVKRFRARYPASIMLSDLTDVL